MTDEPVPATDDAATEPMAKQIMYGAIGCLGLVGIFFVAAMVYSFLFVDHGIVASTKLQHSAYDPGDPYLGVRWDGELHQGKERYRQVRLRGHLFIGGEEIATFVRGPRSNYGGGTGGWASLVPTQDLSPKIAAMRKAGVARLVLDELKGSEIVAPAFAEFQVPLRFSSWNFKHPDAVPSPLNEGNLDPKGRRHGEWRLQKEENSWYEVGRYEHGKRDGIWARFSLEGKQTGESTYRKGVPHGPYWSKSEHFEAEGTYSEGKMHGPTTTTVFTHMKTATPPRTAWSTDKGTYEKGKKVGVWISTFKGLFDADGEFRTETTYVNGKKQRSVTTRNGEVWEGTDKKK